MIVQLARFVLFTAGALGGFEVSGFIDWSREVGFPEYLVIILFVILGGSIGFLLGGILGRALERGVEQFGERVEETPFLDMVLGAAGMFAGLLFALVVSTPLRVIEPAWVSVLSIVALFLVSAYVGMQVALLKRAEFAALFGQGPRAEDTPGGTLKHLDTSAVIDGRFAQLVREGFLEGRVVVPAFVVSELQTLADSADDTKRARGRRGLDTLDRLSDLSVDVFDADYSDIRDVDAKLLRLAQETTGAVVTVDYNLTKVARVQGIPVLNLNEIATALRPDVHAGDGLRIRLVKQGKEAGQGVGYMEDGTMVVVEESDDRLGEEVDIVVHSVFQSSAGRMVFARLQGN